MDLLAKFDHAEVNVDNRISMADARFCEANQKAYTEALETYEELKYIWSDMESGQNDCLCSVDSKYRHDYLRSSKGPQITAAMINSHIIALHGDFIKALVAYFKGRYKVTISEEPILKALLPGEPVVRGQADIETFQNYQEMMQSLRIAYRDVVDRILIQLDGRALAEQGVYELRNKCRRAAFWNGGTVQARFERRKDTIRFLESFCRFKGWPTNRWELTEPMQDVVRGICHFETGVLGSIPNGFGELLSWYGTEDDAFDYSNCLKVKQIKLYKNGRVDVRFSSAAYAGEFVNTYLARA